MSLTGIWLRSRRRHKSQSRVTRQSGGKPHLSLLGAQLCPSRRQSAWSVDHVYQNAVSGQLPDSRQSVHKNDSLLLRC